MSDSFLINSNLLKINFFSWLQNPYFLKLELIILKLQNNQSMWDRKREKSEDSSILNSRGTRVEGHGRESGENSWELNCHGDGGRGRVAIGEGGISSKWWGEIRDAREWEIRGTGYPGCFSGPGIREFASTLKTVIFWTKKNPGPGIPEKPSGIRDPGTRITLGGCNSNFKDSKKIWSPCPAGERWTLASKKKPKTIDWKLKFEVFPSKNGFKNIWEKKKRCNENSHFFVWKKRRHESSKIWSLTRPTGR